MRLEGVPGAGLSRQRMRSLRWRSDAVFACVGGRAAARTGLIVRWLLHQRPLVPAQRLAHQPRRPKRSGIPFSPPSAFKMATISGRAAASGCMRWLGGTAPEARVDLPTVLAPAGAAWHDAGGRSSCTLVDAMAVGCALRDGARGHCPRFRSHHDGGRMRALGCGSKAFPAMTCPGNGCLPRDGGRMPDSRALAVRPRQSWG
jgi:hypothetical protein